MIDILSVMVAFLLVYSTEVEVLQNSKGIEIPQSISEQRPRQTVVVMLTKDDLFVQGERVASINDVRTSNDPIIEPLRDALKRPSLVGQEMTAKDIEAREITVMADKTIPYEILKKVMSTCTDADYGRLSFALVQKEKAVDVNKVRRQLRRAEKT